MIEIYRGEDGRFRVEVDGKEIERLKSFSVSVSNARRPSGEYEAPSYCVEQYMSRESSGGFKKHLPDEFRDDGQRDVHDGTKPAL